MLSWNEPDWDRWDARPEEEQPWPGDLPEHVEEWNQLYYEHTVSPAEWFAYEEAHLGVEADAA